MPVGMNCPKYPPSSARPICQDLENGDNSVWLCAMPRRARLEPHANTPVPCHLISQSFQKNADAVGPQSVMKSSLSQSDLPASFARSAELPNLSKYDKLFFSINMSCTWDILNQKTTYYLFESLCLKPIMKC